MQKSQIVQSRASSIRRQLGIKDSVMVDKVWIELISSMSTC